MQNQNDLTKINLESPKAIKIRKLMTKALSEYSMIDPNDKIMVAVSGGKDSTLLTIMLQELQKKAPFEFSFEAVMLDQKQPGFEPSAFKSFMEAQGVKLTILEEDTYSIVKDKIPEGNTYCSLCSRLRRGILYTYAFQNGFNKIALGHHRDDMLETFLMNLFFSGKIASMPPKLYSKDHRNIVIRPLTFVAEKDIVELATEWNFPILPCNLCGSQDGLKRDAMTKLLTDLEKENPDIRNSMANALSNVEVSHLLDKDLFDFKNDHRVKSENSSSINLS